MFRVDIECNNCKFCNPYALDLNRRQSNGIQNSLMLNQNITCVICKSNKVSVYVRGEAEVGEKYPIEDSLKW